MEENGFDLFDYLKIIYKKKWLIVSVTAVFLLGGFLFSLLFKPIYEVDALLLSAKFLTQNQGGNFEEIVVEEPQQIADKVNHKSYDARIAAELGLSARELQDIYAEKIRDTIMTRVWIRSRDIELSKKILSQLISLIREDMDKKIDVELKDIDYEIRQNEIDKEGAKTEIEILNKKILISKQRQKDLIKEMESIKLRIGDIEEEQMKALKKESRSEAESLALLLYSNEIQQSLRSYEMLNEKLADERMREEAGYSEVKQQETKIQKADNEITILNERRGRLDFTKVIKEPTPSAEPVSPGLGLVVLVSFVLGLMISVLLALLVDYIQKRKGLLST